MPLQKLRVKTLTLRANDVMDIVLEPLAGKSPDYKAGQFLTLVFSFNGRELRRTYSLYSSPVADEPLAIAVKLVSNGEISRYLHDHIQEGDILEATEPNGLFVYEPEPLKRRTVFLFAAGVGITPLFSILKTALISEPFSKIILVYSSRSAEKAVFIDELRAWQKKYPERFELIHLFSNSKNLRRARLNGFLVQELIREYITYDPGDALFYTCGPIDYMDVCRISILSDGYQALQIKRETFLLPDDAGDEDDMAEKEVDKNTYSVQLIYRGQMHQLSVPYPKRILEVALEHGIAIPYSCSGGVCGTCAANCLSGGVRMDYNEILTDEEIRKGRVLVCTGHPTADQTKISWD